MAMVSSLFTAISGMRSHQTLLDVIANNVANVNTIGYKSGRVQFRDLLSQTVTSAIGSNPLTNRGGINPVQLGLGSGVASIDTIHTQGTLQLTGNATDMAITGDGYFMLKNGSQTLYTRAGGFSFDSTGRLVDSSGALVQGWMAQTPTNDPLARAMVDSTNSTSIGNIEINSGMTMQAQETRNIELKGNLDAGSYHQNLVNSAGLPGTTQYSVTDGLGTVYDYTIGQHIIKFEVFDSLGNAHKLNITFSNISGTQQFGQPPGTVGGDNEWAYTVSVDPSDTSVIMALDNMTYTDPVTGELVRSSRNGGIHFEKSSGVDGTPDHGGQDDANTPAELAFFGITADPHVGQHLSWENLVVPPGDFVGDTTLTPGTAPFFDNPGLAGFAPFELKKLPVVLLYQSVPDTTPIGPAGVSAGTLVNVNYTDMTTTAATPTTWYAQKFFIDLGTMTEWTDFDIDKDEDGIWDADNAPMIVEGPNKSLADGLTQYTTGEFQLINGVQTYIPKHEAVMTTQDGYASGVLQAVQVDATGTIVGKFSNNQVQELAQVALATFENPNGLSKVGGVHFSSTANSGLANIGTALTGARGQVVGGALEQSNVDLAKELTDMIVAQRGFEVNARLVSTADRILDTLVNLGR